MLLLFDVRGILFSSGMAGFVPIYDRSLPPFGAVAGKVWWLKGWFSLVSSTSIMVCLSGLSLVLPVCIQTGDIVWVHGPFPCGSWPDLKIFRSSLKYRLGPGEMVEADAGYPGEPRTVRVPRTYVSTTDRLAKERARARHETVNKRLKQWDCLKKPFRHDRRKHMIVFKAVAVITQLCFEAGEGPFQLRY